VILPDRLADPSWPFFRIWHDLTFTSVPRSTLSETTIPVTSHVAQRWLQRTEEGELEASGRSAYQLVGAHSAQGGSPVSRTSRPFNSPCQPNVYSSWPFTAQR
jgi:hypothetical protein